MSNQVLLLQLCNIAGSKLQVGTVELEETAPFPLKKYCIAILVAKIKPL